jgi:molecular chaperone GrpE
VSDKLVTEDNAEVETIETIQADTAESPSVKVTTEEKVAEVEKAGESADQEDDQEEPLSLEEQLEAARAEAAKNLDGWMRAQAEFANARKRMEKQRSETYLNATADLVMKLLPVLDDFSRALAEVPNGIAGDGWLEGILLVQRKLDNILESLNVKPIEAVGQPFDPNYHEAIMQEPSEEQDSGTVTRELQQGYLIGERVIRPSLVYVAE